MTTRSTKRTSGDYEIYAGANVAGTYTGTVRIHGNLDVVGATSFIESTNTQISDTVITLNQGETGAGVGGGTGVSGIEVARGTQPKVAFRYNESITSWELTNDGSTYSLIATGNSSVNGSNTWVQFNDGGSFGSNIHFTYDKTTDTLTAGNVTLSAAGIGTTGTNQDLLLDPNGTGNVVANAVVGLYYHSGTPSSVASNVFIYANTPSTTGTGIYYVNTTSSDELVSKKKAKLYAWIF
jgi:hypothetical protein